jgi:hypothetical protein
VGELALRLDSGRNHDPGRCRAQRIEVVLVVRAADHVLAQHRVVATAVVLGRHSELRRVDRPLREVGRDRALERGQGEELRHPGPEAVAHVGLVDVPSRRERLFAVGQHRRGRRLVRDDRAHLLGVLRDEREAIVGAPARAEEVHRPDVERVDQPVQVVGVVVGRGLRRAVGPLTARDAAHVVGHHRAVGEVPGERGEAAGVHRRSGEQQRGRTAVALGFAHVVGENGSGNFQGVCTRLGHRCPF